jgi:Tfp pilus assembly major pilin PilA
LFTGFTLLCALICAACVYVSAAITLELQKDRGRVSNLEHELDAVSGQVHKLRQKIYSPSYAKPAIEIAQQETPCENWAQAKTLGPASIAAKCACSFCIAQRNERDALRATLRPSLPRKN